MASTARTMSTNHTHHPPQPPVPFADFQFSFDPSIHPLFPDPPPVPPSAELFSPSETTNLFGFLDNFNWEFDGNTFGQQDNGQQIYVDFQSNGYQNGSNGTTSRQLTRPPSSQGTDPNSNDDAHEPSQRKRPRISPPPRESGSPSSVSSQAPNPPRPKSLLSSPQKRMNHIMSEQKRRNAIREGYAQLTTLLAPAGAPPGTGMPTRGRPKGSGARGKGRPGKGKSGVLLRAVEYCRWLEEGRDALKEEVRRVEAAAGFRVDF